MTRRRRRLPQDVNVLAVVVVLAATLLAALEKVPAESVLLLLTGLAIPARATGYMDANPAAVDPEAGT